MNGKTQTRTPRVVPPKPRNPVIEALTRGFGRRGAGVHADGHARQRQERDLADRIREVGEW